ncbi:hypothetical protein G6F22_016385 [Rhizopus arrhizus]|nr:hypothetical protein G6F22_016385 [Rhizopus arrhizus]
MHHVRRQAERAFLVVDMRHVQERLLQALAAQQRLPLGQAIGQQHAVCVGAVGMALQAGDEVHRRTVFALVQPLEERVLPIGTRHAPDDRRRRHAHGRAVAGGPQAQRLHFQLLQIRHQVQQARAFTKPASASWIGAFEANGACWKCSSIASAPARMPSSTSAPTVNAIDRPATDHTE